MNRMPMAWFSRRPPALPLARYPDWLEAAAGLADADRAAIARHIGAFAERPRFRVCLLAAGEPPGAEAWEPTRASLTAQLYGDFSVAILADHDQWSTCLDGLSESDWLVFLRPGDRLAEHALYWFAVVALAQPGMPLIYADDDVCGQDGHHCLPRFKPDWSLAHLRATDYLGNAVAVRGDAARAVGAPCPVDAAYGLYDLLLRVAEGANDAVGHVPAVLLHRGLAPAAALAEQDARSLVAVREHLDRCGVGASVSVTQAGHWRVRYRLPEPAPLVSVIVPTRDALDLLRRCLDSLFERTTYPRYEVLVVDNGSVEPATLAYLAEMEGREGALRVLRDGAPFNFAALNNRAAEAARGEVLCLLNNDTEVIAPDWLDEMVGHLLQERVGVVGAKLYYPDGRVQHGGDVVGVGGTANHLHAGLGGGEPGYCRRASVAQELSAVTAACMVTRRGLYLELGGLDEGHLPIAFNDVDYCLRVREAGHKVVWTPHAELYHHESPSRGRDKSLRRRWQASREVRYMRRRWSEVLRDDPFYNPNFSRARADFTLDPQPRVSKPWQGF
ncbi:MAG: glycosyltransferase [Thiobacillus sp.]|nr:glycosyltransferase [Thiobacillus sp.]